MYEVTFSNLGFTNQSGSLNLSLPTLSSLQGPWGTPTKLNQTKTCASNSLPFQNFQVRGNGLKWSAPTQINKREREGRKTASSRDHFSLWTACFCWCGKLKIRYFLSTFGHTCSNILKQEKEPCLLPHKPLGLWFRAYDPEFGSTPSDRKLAAPSSLILRLHFSGRKEFYLELGGALCLALQPVTQSPRNLTDRDCLSGERCEWARLSLPSQASPFCFWLGSGWLCSL